VSAPAKSESATAELLRSTRVISDMMTRDEIEIVLRELELALLAGVPGAVVELGCNCGTTSIFIARLLERLGESRAYHVYDSFTGLPPAGAQDEGRKAAKLAPGTFAVDRAEFTANLERAGARLPEIHEGAFDHLGPGDLPDEICWAFLDGDLYRSILTSLELTYPRLQPGGAIVVDDYGWERLPGVERACADFLADKPESAVGAGDATIGIISKEPRS
jgi:O-methyltransferase